MEKLKNVVVVVGVIAALVLSVVALSKPAAIQSVVKAGGVAQDDFNHRFFHGGVDIGGGCTSSSTANSAETLLATAIDDENCLSYKPTVQSVTLTLPASSTISLPRFAGETKLINIFNATSTSGVNVTIAMGTGDILKNATNTLVLNPGNVGQIQLVRSATTSDILVLFDKLQ